MTARRRAAWLLLVGGVWLGAGASGRAEWLLVAMSLGALALIDILRTPDDDPR